MERTSGKSGGFYGRRRLPQMEGRKKVQSSPFLLKSLANSPIQTSMQDTLASETFDDYLINLHIYIWFQESEIVLTNSSNVLGVLSRNWI